MPEGGERSSIAEGSQAVEWQIAIEICGDGADPIRIEIMAWINDVQHSSGRPAMRSSAKIAHKWGGALPLRVFLVLPL